MFDKRAIMLVGFLAWIVPNAAWGHPMGNFSISHYARIAVSGDSEVELRYILDLAEIPTFQEMQRSGMTASSTDPSARLYLERQREMLQSGLLMQVDGHRLRLKPVSMQILFAAGAGGLPTMKLGFLFRASLSAVRASSARIHYSDSNFKERAGWKEVVCDARGSRLLSSSGCGPDRSQQLSNYPTDLLNSPPQDLEAEFAVVRNTEPTLAGSRPPASVPAIKSVVPSTSAAIHKTTVTSAGSPAMNLEVNRQLTPRNAFTELATTKGAGFWFFLFATLVAVGLGGLHALEPGHGKTLVAAYLVGSRGTALHAVLLGLIVTAAHTAGVYLLAGITLYASRYFFPDQLYPWLGLVSGLITCGLGIFLLLRNLSGAELSHAEDSAHTHWFLRAGGGSQNTAVAGRPASPIRFRQLLLLGLTGGMVPCPGALVVLLSAVSLRRIGFGLFLIVAFSFGLAAVLISVGLAMVYARAAVARWSDQVPLLRKWLPALSGIFIALLGLGIGLRSFGGTALGHNLTPAGGWWPLVGIAGLGLFLGMRHSTDPDHVVAVSTIVSRQGSVQQGALIGMAWGIGHTLTIFVVGSAIILFGLVIPRRLGLGMEFLVALMLVLLGIIRLVGWKPGRADRRPSTDALSQASAARTSVLQRGYRWLRPLAIGIVHGLAGSAAVALLVLSMIHRPGWAICYLLLFGLGTVIGMMLMTTAIALPFTLRGARFERMSSYFGVTAGFVSLGFGGFLIYQIGFLSGLFSAHPHWTPH